MKRAILVDGNNLLFRSYYATAYSGSMMKNSKGFPTNAIFGFVNMINKIVNEEKPEYMVVAFDKGKNFRHAMFDAYKDGRIKTPEDLLMQFKPAKEILGHLGIKYLEVDNYEADDIIGTFARLADEDKNYDATIVSSDKDLLQLISSDVSVKLLKQSGFVLMNEKSFKELYGVEPIKIIDLKALQGDPSDNIPGVKGIGEKTAITLIKEYQSIENLYNHIDDVNGKIKEKLISDKDNAFFSKKLATICKTVPINMSFEDLKMCEPNLVELNAMFEELEFFSFIKKINKNVNKDFNISNDVSSINKDFSFYLEIDNSNYHIGNVIGLGIYDGSKYYYLNKDEIINNKDIFKYAKYTYDLKKCIVSLNRLGINIDSVNYDALIAGYLLNYNVKEDISYLSNTRGYDIAFYNLIVNKKNPMNEIDIKKNICLKAKFIYDSKDEFLNDISSNGLKDLFNDIEMPLTYVLADMEKTGISVCSRIIEEIKEVIDIKIERLSNDIYNLCGESFNISSPKQLSEILFEKLNLPHGKKKGRNGYSTDQDSLIKISGINPVISLILEYRNLSKLSNTYLNTLCDFILSDGRIHTIYNQALTRTGRLSSESPNLQNIPVRTEEGKQIRKAFLPEKDSSIMTSDYSQIELRVLAHIANDNNLITAFNNKEDIHTHVASDIFGVPEEAVTKNMRRNAKAVIFGIVYGISGFGLGENLDINPKEAKKLIDKYLTMYPSVKNYMVRIKEEATKNGYVTTLMNRKRMIDELSNTNYIIRSAGERIALNTPIQGTSADIIKKSMVEIFNEFNKRGLKSKMLLQVHDELVFNVVNNEKEIVQSIVTNIMENTYKLVVPLKVEVDFGSNWFNAK